MFESDATLLLVAACGLVLLRPSDVPLLARYAGRATGIGVRSLRGLRDATDAAMKEGESVFAQHAGNGVGSGLRESLSKFDSLRTTLSRDVARFAPFDKLNRGIAGAMRQNAAKPVLHGKSERNDATSSPNLTSTTSKLLTTVHRTETSTGEQTAGVDFIARSIEEAALARQQERVFGKTLHDENQSECETRPNDFDPRSRG
ncbi:unnamed protein product [Chondrus crispus]|uniref:Sec-independent protein translocase protein TatB n=1 Tax=Chondrus crispus TaxID=2769 RepID=R7QP69_CHOCR|nr:unnamed protein product [Chondrus crispus]CDF39185.1 unnamed protein product [Chondrus crispus]|eukprot:XP_005719096.1 unnamed protein product [Chondrus crispus]